MENIAIYGAGGFGREVFHLIQNINKKAIQWNFIGFFDDGIEIGRKFENGSILGGLEELNNYPEKLAVVLAIATPKIVKCIVNKIKSTNIYFPNIISSDTIFIDRDSFHIGYGNIISFQNIISCNVSIGNFNILNWGTKIGHDVNFEDYNALMPDVKISGEVSIGSTNFFGVNSTILQQIKIGHNTIIGANSLILKNTKDGMTYIGNPAFVVKF